MKQERPQSTDQYIAAFPPAIRKMMEQLRAAIRAAAPDAAETISYGMPAFKLNGPLVYFAAYEHHIGFYPTASGIRHFLNDISNYKHSKGAVQFPLDQPLPLELVARITAFRVAENEARVQKKKAGIKNENNSFAATLSAPAQRALKAAGIHTLRQLSRHSESALLSLHGFGPASLIVLRAALADQGLSFKN